MDQGKKDSPPAFSSPWGAPQTPVSQQRNSNASDSTGSNSRTLGSSSASPDDPESVTPEHEREEHEEEARDQPTAMTSALPQVSELRGRRASMAPAFSSPFGSTIGNSPALAPPSMGDAGMRGRRTSVAPVFATPFGGDGATAAAAGEDEERDRPSPLSSARASMASDVRGRRASVVPPSFSRPFGSAAARSLGSGSSNGDDVPPSKRRSVKIDLPPSVNPLLKVHDAEKIPMSPSNLGGGMDSPFGETTPFTFSSPAPAPGSRQGSKASTVEFGKRTSTAAGANGSLFGGFGGFSSAAPKPANGTSFVSPFEKAPVPKASALKGDVTPPIHRATARKEFTSSRLAGEVHKPWLEKRDGRETAARWLYIAFSLTGIIGGAVLAFFNYQKVPRLGNVCLVLEENFDKLDPNVWLQEVEVGGYGNGQFEWTTSSTNNSFVEDGILYIVPTLTEDHLGHDAIFNGVNMTVDGCTAAKAPNTSSCIVYSNSTEGKVINPVQSARLSTRISHSVKYGRIEVRARLPTGDWLWPAIWMLPTNSTYGEWPASGEIDIMESRGNGWKYGAMGADWITSTIHWGPLTGFDRSYKTTGTWQDRHGIYSDKWHTYVVEWNEEFIWIYLDTRTVRIFNLKFNKPFWDRGDFPPVFNNGTHDEVLPNPWQGASNVAPFDQDFYLILNVAVGGTNGWFPDNIGEKPWFDNSPTAMKDFINAKDKWWPTWPADVKKRGMAIDWVKMYQKC